MLGRDHASRRAFAQGAHGFIDKGTPDEELADLILDVFRRARGRASAEAGVAVTP